MQRQGIGRADHQHTLHMGVFCRLMAALIRHIQADKQVRIHFLDVFADALGAVTGVHQIQRCTDHVGSVERINDLRCHHADHCGDIAFLHADGAEGGGCLFHVDDQVRISDPAAIVIDRGLGQVVLVLMADVLECGAVGYRLVDELLIIVFQPRLCSRSINRFVRLGYHTVSSSLVSSSF